MLSHELANQLLKLPNLPVTTARSLLTAVSSVDVVNVVPATDISGNIAEDFFDYASSDEEGATKVIGIC